MIEEQIAPGVRGYTVEHNGATYIPLVIAENPGNGDVSRFLDSLDPSKTWKFPCVLSPRLEQMLLRRGFEHVIEWAEEMEEDVEVYVRKAQKEGAKE